MERVTGCAGLERSMQHLTGTASNAGHGDRTGNRIRTERLLRHRDTELRSRSGHLTRAALTRSMLERRWITTREASRIVTVTEAGEAGLREWPGVDLAVL